MRKNAIMQLRLTVRVPQCDWFLGLTVLAGGRPGHTPEPYGELRGRRFRNTAN